VVGGFSHLRFGFVCTGFIIRKRTVRTLRALATDYFGLVSNRAINLVGVLVTLDFG
jgi:hypothetical protein